MSDNNKSAPDSEPREEEPWEKELRRIGQEAGEKIYRNVMKAIKGKKPGDSLEET